MKDFFEHEKENGCWYAALDSNNYITKLSSTPFDEAVKVIIEDDFQWQYMPSYQLTDGAVVQDATVKQALIIQEQSGAAEDVRGKASNQLRENLLLVAATANMTDEEIYRYEEAHPVWTVGEKYLHGQVVYYAGDGNIYRCQQSLDARASNPPGTPGIDALYALVQRPVKPGGVLPWVYGEEVHPGDRRAFEGKVYERISPWSAGTNIWEPKAAPGVWGEVAGG